MGNAPSCDPLNTDNPGRNHIQYHDSTFEQKYSYRISDNFHRKLYPKMQYHFGVSRLKQVEKKSFMIETKHL